MTESNPTPEDFLGNPEPAIWAEIERYAKNNDECCAALLSLRARVEQLEANAKATPKFDQIGSSDITSPLELVQQWASESLATQNLCNRAAQWGAEQELEACCQYLDARQPTYVSKGLRTARRPKSLSLKEQALQEVDALEGMGTCNVDTIRRALERLDD